MGRTVRARPAKEFLRVWVVSGLILGISVLCCTAANPWVTRLRLPVRFTGFLWCVLITALFFIRLRHHNAMQDLLLGMSYGTTSIMVGAHLIKGVAGSQFALLTESVWMSVLVLIESMFSPAHSALPPNIRCPVAGVVAIAASALSTADIADLAASLGLTPDVARILPALLLFASSYNHSRHDGNMQQVLSRAFSVHGWAALAGGFRGAALAATLADAFLLASMGQDGMHIFRRERQVAEYNRRAKLVIDHLGCGVVVVDSAETVTVCNPVAERLLGLHGKAVAGKPLAYLLEWLPEGLNPLAEMLSFRNTQHDMRLEVEATIEGQSRYWRIQSGPVIDETGGACGLVIIIEDLTEKKRMADKVAGAERLASAGKLAASAAHEIRNPLTAVKGLLHLALLSTPDPAAGSIRACEGIIDEIERAVTQILSLVKPRTPVIARVDLSEVVPGIFTAGDGNRGRISLIVDLNSPAVMTDRTALRQGLQAIADSISDAMPGSVVLRISARVDDDARHAVILLEVPDLRIPARKAALVFQPSFKANGVCVGFGMSLGKRLLEEGGATVEAVPGGNEFALRVRLPLADKSRTTASPGGGS